MMAIGETFNRDVERVAAFGAAVPVLGDGEMDGKSFARLLGQELDGPGGADRDVEGAAREAATGLVSAAFIQPFLKMLRNDPLKSELFHGGRGEEMFGAMLDQHLSDNLAGRIAPGLIDSIQRTLMGGMGGGAGVGTGLNASA